MICRRLLVGLIVIPALVAGMTAVRVSAQTQPGPSLDVHPYGTKRTDPDGGQWFFADGAPGRAQSFQVRLYNPTNQDKAAKLFLADMAFNATGTPYVVETKTDVAKWGTFEHDRVTVPARRAILESFTLTPPKAADPGDHIGAAVVEEAPVGGGPFRSVTRVALRVYITLPGDARKEFEIKRVLTEKRSKFFPKKLDVTTELANTGRVRLETTVAINGSPAKGSTLLLSKSIERYRATFPIRFWGGPMRLKVDATTRSLGLPGPSREMFVTVWVIPWHILSALALLALLALGVRWLLKRRARKVQAMQADLRRLERLLVQQTRQAATGTVDEPARRDAEAAIRSAVKQAKRAGDDKTAERLERKLSDNAMRKCPSCGGMAPIAAKHCGRCGTSLGAAS